MADGPAPPPPIDRSHPRPVRVVRTAPAGPRFQRVTFGGEALEGFALTTSTTHVKLFLPGAARTGAEVVRSYTPRRFDPQRRELDVEFYLHGKGPASRWAARARPGDAGRGRRARSRLHGRPVGRLVPPRRRRARHPGHLRHRRVGAPTPPRCWRCSRSAPPATRCPLPDHPRLEVTWAHREAARGGPRSSEALAGLGAPRGDGRAWVAAESRAVRRIRRHLLDDRGMPPTAVVTRGYWRAGEPDHTDADFGRRLTPGTAPVRAGALSCR